MHPEKMEAVQAGPDAVTDQSSQATPAAVDANSSREGISTALEQLLDRCQHAAEVLIDAGELLGKARTTLEQDVGEAAANGLDQVLAGLDDVLMCLAELQLQQEGKGSCASALEKASTCMHQLQDSLSVGTSTGQHKLAVEAQSVWRQSWAGLRRDRAGVAAVHKAVSDLLGLAGSDECWNGGAVHEAMELLHEARTQLAGTLQQQCCDLESTCPHISSCFEALMTHSRANTSTSSDGSSSMAGKAGPQARSGSPAGSRPSSRLSRMATPSPPPLSPRVADSCAGVSTSAPGGAVAPSCPAAAVAWASTADASAADLQEEQLPSQGISYAEPAEPGSMAEAEPPSTGTAPASGSAGAEAAVPALPEQPPEPQACSADSPCSSNAGLLQQDWQGQLQRLQQQLQDSDAASAEQLQAATQALLQLSQQLQQERQAMQAGAGAAALANPPGTLFSSPLPPKGNMRRWSNPVFSACGAEQVEQGRSTQPMLSCTGLAMDPSAVHTNLTFRRTDGSSQGGAKDDPDSLPVWTSMPWRAADAGVPVLAAGDAARMLSPGSAGEGEQESAAAMGCMQACADSGAQAYPQRCSTLQPGSVFLAECDSEEAVSPHSTSHPPMQATRLHPCELHDTLTFPGSVVDDRQEAAMGCIQACADSGAQAYRQRCSALQPRSVFLEDCDSEEALSPHSTTHPPMQISRLPPCDPQDSLAFPPTWSAAHAKAGGELGTAGADALQGSKAAVKAALLPGAGMFSSMQDCSCTPLAVYLVGDGGVAALGPIAGGVGTLASSKPRLPAKLDSSARHMATVPAGKGTAAQDLPLHQMQDSTLGSSLQQLLLALQHASSVLGPAALAALKSSSLSPEDATLVQAAACKGLADAALLHNQMQNVMHLVLAQQQQDTAAAAGLAAQGSLAADVAQIAAAGPLRVWQDTAGSCQGSGAWTIPAVYAGHCSHKSSEGNVELPSSRFATRSSGGGMEHTHVLEAAAGVQPAAHAHTADAAGSAGVCSTDPPGDGGICCSSAGEAAMVAPSAAAQGRLPSLDLFASADDALAGSLLEGDCSGLLFGGAAAASILEGDWLCLSARAAAGTDTAEQQPRQPAASAAEAAAAVVALWHQQGQLQEQCLASSSQHAALLADAALPHAQLLPARPQSAPGAVQAPAGRHHHRRSSVALSSHAEVLSLEDKPEDSPRQQHISCIPFPWHMRKAIKAAKKQMHHPHPAGRPTEDVLPGLSRQGSDATVQQQVMLVWSLRDQLAAAELKLKQHQEQQEQHSSGGAASAPGGRRARAATCDEVSLMPTAPLGSSSGGALAAAKARRNTCDSAVLGRSPLQQALAQQALALKAFIASTSRPGSPSKVAGSVQTDGRIIIEPAQAAAEPEQQQLPNSQPQGSAAAAAQPADPAAQVHQNAVADQQQVAGILRQSGRDHQWEECHSPSQPTTEHTAASCDSVSEQRAQLQQQKALLEEQLEASQANVRQQQEALQAASQQAAESERAAQQQLEAAHAEVQGLTELLSLHEDLLQRLQAAAAEAGQELAACTADSAQGPAAALSDPDRELLSLHEALLLRLQEAAAAVAAEAVQQPARSAGFDALHPPAAAEPSEVQDAEPAAAAANANLSSCPGLAPPLAAAAAASMEVSTAGSVDPAGQLQAKYNEQVIQQLASEVGRLQAEQAAAEVLRTQLAAASERNAALQAEVDALSQRLADGADQQEQSAQQLAGEVGTLQAAAAGLQTHLAAASERNAALQTEADALSQRLAEAAEQQEQSAQQLASEVGKVQAEQAVAAVLQTQLVAASERNAALQAEVDSLSQRLAEQQEQAEAEALRTQLAAASERIAALQAEVQALSQRLAEAAEQEEQSAQQLASEFGRLQAEHAKAEVLRAQLATASERNTALQPEVATLSQQLAEAASQQQEQAAAGVLQAQLAAAEHSAALQAEVDALSQRLAADQQERFAQQLAGGVGTLQAAAAGLQTQLVAASERNTALQAHIDALSQQLGEATEQQEQVTQQLVVEVAALDGMLQQEQAAAEALRTQLAAASERNAALQAEVDALSQRLAEIAQQQEAAAAAAVNRRSSTGSISAQTLPAEGLVCDHGAAQRCQKPGDVSQDAKTLLQFEHAAEEITRQQLKDATAAADAATARAHQLQLELTAVQDCNADLRSQLQRMAGTLAELEAATVSTDEVHEWPSCNQAAASAPHHQQQLQRQMRESLRSLSDGMLLDAVAQAELVQGLSDAFNKQAELQDLLQQREKQLQELRAQLCNSQAAAAGVTCPEAAAPAPVLALLQQLQAGVAEHAAVSASGNSLSQEVAALLASSPQKPAEPDRFTAAAAAEAGASAPGSYHQQCAEAAASRSSAAAGAACAQPAASTEPSGPYCCTSSGSHWCSDDHEGAPASGAVCADGPNRLSHGHGAEAQPLSGRSDASAATQVPTAHASAQFLTWGSMEARERHSGSNTARSGFEECPSAPLVSSRNSGIRQATAAALHGPSPHEGLQQLKEQLEASQAQLCSTSAQLQQLQAAYSAQEDYLAKLLLQLETAEPLLPHEAAAAEAEAVTASSVEVEAVALSVEAEAVASWTTAVTAAVAATAEGSLSESAAGETGAEVHTGVSSTGAVGDSSSSHKHVLQGVRVATASTSGLCGCSDAVEMPPSTEVSKLPRVSATENSNMWHLPGVSSSALLQRHSLCEWGSQPATPGMATPAAADCKQLLHQLQAHAEAGSQEQQQQQFEESNGVEQHPPVPSQLAPPVPAISPAAAAAVASQLLVAARAATAQAAAAEAAQQQLAQELAIQHELHELQQQELAVLKQRLVTSGDEATRLGSLLQSKHQQLQQLHVRVQRQQQEKQELQRQLQQQQQQLLQTPPGSSSKASHRPVGYVAAAAAAAAGAAAATPAAGSSRPSGAAVQVTNQGQGACRFPSVTPAAVVSSNADAVGAVAPCRRSPSPVRSNSPARAATNAGAERERGVVGRSSDELALRGSMDGGGDVVYANAEEVRRLSRELATKERCIAALQATNRLHKQQLQQLAQSAAQAGWQVTPEHLLCIADAPSRPPAAGPLLAGTPTAAAYHPLSSPPAAAAAAAAPICAGSPAKSAAGQDGIHSLRSRTGSLPASSKLRRSIPSAAAAAAVAGTKRVMPLAGFMHGADRAALAEPPAGGAVGGDVRSSSNSIPLQQLKQQRRAQQAAHLASPGAADNKY